MALAVMTATGGPDDEILHYLPLTDEQAEFILASLSDFADDEAETVCNRLRKLLGISNLSIVK